jgi:hypothetical protein
VRNQHPGTCYRCGQLCAAGEGHFERMPYGFYPRWRVQHAACAIEHRGQADEVTSIRNDRMQAAAQRRTEERAQGTGKRAQRARARLRQQANMETHP